MSIPIQATQYIAAIAVAAAAVVAGELPELAIANYAPDIIAVCFGITMGGALQLPRLKRGDIGCIEFLSELMLSGMAGFGAHAIAMYIGMTDLRVIWFGAAISGGLGATGITAMGKKYYPFLYSKDDKR